MKEAILSNLDNPVQLETLYRADKPAFKEAFKILSPELKDATLIGFWNARLNFAKEETTRANSFDAIFLALVAVIAGVVAKAPAILHIPEPFFYMRNIGFIVFPFLSAYFVWKSTMSVGKIALMGGVVLAAMVFINLLPESDRADTLILSCIHLPILLWSVLGFAFTGGENNTEKRLGFLTYNGDLIVMTTLILIAGAILTGVTIGLFSLIGFKIENFYFDYIVVFALPAAPILGTYLIQMNPQLVGRVSPVIAKIFSPLVLVMLVIYLIAIISTGKDPYNDREFLIVFNALLVGVLAIIFFSVAETTKGTASRMQVWMIFLLSCVTVVVNAIALSAIVFRISTWGFTPNRAAVLGSNGLIFINLVLVAVQLFRAISNKGDIKGVGSVISRYLPVYCIWAVIVTFLFPLIFGFK